MSRSFIVKALRFRPDKSGASSFVVNTSRSQGQVQCVKGVVIMGIQIWLLIRMVPKQTLDAM